MVNMELSASNRDEEGKHHKLHTFSPSCGAVRVARALEAFLVVEVEVSKKFLWHPQMPQEPEEEEAQANNRGDLAKSAYC